MAQRHLSELSLQLDVGAGLLYQKFHDFQMANLSRETQRHRSSDAVFQLDIGASLRNQWAACLELSTRIALFDFKRRPKFVGLWGFRIPKVPHACRAITSRHRAKPMVQGDSQMEIPLASPVYGKMRIPVEKGFQMYVLLKYILR